MVARPVLSELDVNAIVGALDERTQRLAVTYVRLREQPESTDRETAIGFTEDAIRDALRARLVVVEAAEEDMPDNATVRHAEHEEPLPSICSLCEAEMTYFLRYGYERPTEPELRALYGDR